MQRRSTNQAVDRRRYTVDAFDGIEELRDAVSDDDDDDPMMRDRSDSDGTDDFEARRDESLEDEDERFSVEGAVAEEILSEASDAGEPEAIQKSSSSAKVSKQRKDLRSVDGEKLYTRGLQDSYSRNASKESRRLHNHGPAPKDYEPLDLANRRWSDEPTFPSRTSDEDGRGGLHHSYFQTDEARLKEATEGCKWYSHEGGQTSFDQRQAMFPLTESRANEYMIFSGAVDRGFLMGPFDNPRLFKLPVGQSVPLKEAWKSEGTTADLPSNYKPGFVVNLGSKVHCVDWVPNHSRAQQYLAVSVLPQRRIDRTAFQMSTAPSFTAQRSHKSNIQILQLAVDPNSFIDTGSTLKLKLVLCTAWGDVRALKWCPMSSGDSGTLGLLAGIWGDGRLRVLDVPRPALDSETVYLHVERAAFESDPPATLFTCLAWLSPSRLAAGCANGCIAVWNIPQNLKSSAANARPQVYSSISPSYVLSITSCYPSHPNLVITASMAGRLSLTDLSRPFLNSAATTVVSQRVRTGHPKCAWSDFAQCALSVDDNFTIRGYSTRRWTNTIGLGRARSLATIIATSPCHPFTLVGTANGEVLATNPLRRVVDVRAGLWQQVWFAHEWRRPNAEEQQAAAAAAAAAGESGEEGLPAAATVAAGLSRISEGYRIEPSSLNNDEHGLTNRKDGVLFATVYEEKSAITALAWNPNIHVGGWAAAGMADGLLRVEDIAT